MTLHNCPFCDDTASISLNAIAEVFHAVDCGACGARGPVCGSETHDEEFGDNYVAAARRDAAVAWNAAPRSPNGGVT